MTKTIYGINCLLYLKVFNDLKLMIKNCPKISVIVPVYKVEKFIHECIDSIINQDYKNLEILLIDDGSPDKCPQICDEYAAKDNRIKVFHTKNQGSGPARNVGLNNATGDYITFIDSDDWINQGLYNYFINLVQLDNDSDIFIFKRNNEKTDIEWKTYDKETFIKEASYPFICKTNARIGLMNSAWRLICKKTIVGNIRFCNTYLEDKPFFLEVLLKSKKITLLPMDFYNYRVNNESLTNKYVNNYAENLKFVMRKQHELLKKYGAFEIHPKIIKYHKYAIIRYYLDLLKNEGKLPESSKDTIAIIKQYYREMEVDKILTLGLTLRLTLKKTVWLSLKFNRTNHIIEKYRKKTAKLK